MRTVKIFLDGLYGCGTEDADSEDLVKLVALVDEHGSDKERDKIPDKPLLLAVNYNIVSVFLFWREPWSCASQKRESLTPFFVGQVSPTAFSLIESYSRGPAKHPFGAPSQL